MKISNLIYAKYDFDIMEITNSEDENPLNWSLLALNEEVIPSEGHYLVRSKEILKDEERTCWMNVSTPEMISDYVFTIDAKNSKLVLNNYHSLSDKVLTNKASNTFANYQFYYPKSKPIIGIEMLKKEIENVTEKGLICEYLGNIFRDEQEIDNAIKWLLKSLEYGEPSSEYIYGEIANLYDEKGETELATKYRKKIEKKITA